jgi:hypothetical protein
MRRQDKAQSTLRTWRVSKNISGADSADDAENTATKRYKRKELTAESRERKLKTA